MQIIEKKSHFGGLNTDLALENVVRNDYIDALNIRIGNLVEGEVGVVTNVKGNVLKDVAQVVGAGKKCIGAYEDRKNGRIIYFIADPINSAHGIYEFNIATGAIVAILLGPVLNFTVNHLIIHINVIENRKLNFDEDSTTAIIEKDAYEDMLFWVDRLNAPRQINVQMAKDFTNGGSTPYAYVNEETISLIKAQPPIPPICSQVFVTDGLHNTGNIKHQYFQFKYKWVYANNLKSSLSSASERAYPYGEIGNNTSGTPPLYNAISVTYNTGGALVLKVELYGRTGSSDYQLLNVLDKKVTGTASNLNYQYNFFNDGLYNNVDPLDAANNFDDVPLLAGTQDLADGNILVYGDVVKGYTNITNLSVSITPATVSVGSTQTMNVSTPVYKDGSKYKFGIVYYDQFGRCSAVQSNDSCFVSTLTVSQMGNNGYSSAMGLYQYLNWTVNHIPPAWAKYWAWVRTVNLTQKKYFQFITNGVIDGSDGYLYLDLNNLQVYNDINPSVSGPTGNLNTQVSYQFTPGDRVRIFSRYDIGAGPVRSWNSETHTYGTSSATGGNSTWYPTETDLEVFNYGNVTGKFYGNFIMYRYGVDATPNGWGNHIHRVEYSSQDPQQQQVNYPSFAGTNNLTVNWFGNQVTVIQYPGKDNSYSPPATNLFSIGVNQNFVDYYTLSKHGANGQALQQDLAYTLSGNYLKIKAPTDPAFKARLLADQSLFIEVYTPVKSIGGETPNVFYEFGDKNSIVNGMHMADGTSGTQSQTASLPAMGTFTKGDSFLRTRAIPLTIVTDHMLNRPSPTLNDGYWIYDPGFSDFYPSTFTNNGRPQIYAPDNKQQRYQTQVAFSLEYNPDTSINRLNTFYSPNFQEYDRNFGSIQRIYSEGHRLYVFQEFKIGWIPVNQQIIQAANGAGSLTTSQNLLNPIKYYEYEGGICRNPESFSTSTNGYKYFYDQDNKNGCRVAGDGIDVISDYGAKNLFYNQANLLSAQPNPIRVYSVYDRQNSELLMSFEANGTAPALTLVFNEKLKRWISRVSLAPDFFGDIYSNLYSFKAGLIYQHEQGSLYNNFYGVQYSSSITVVANEHPLNVKTLMGLDYQATSLWSAPQIKTQLGQASNLLASDFQVDTIFNQKEGIYYANFLRDQNSPNGIMTGDFLKGNYTTIQLSNSDTVQARLFSVGVKAGINK